MPADDLGTRLLSIRDAIAAACDRAGRDPAEVTLVAAAKTVPPDTVRRAVDLGVRAVGHNYVQELRAARDALADADVTWHYIGTLQTGTATTVADHADVVETVAGERAARRLAGRAERAGRTLDALLEVDLTGERSGLAPSEVAAAIDALAQVPGIRLRGLMTIAPIGSLEVARKAFRRLRELRDEVRDRHPDVLDLSMGMSLDYEVAVLEGATMVRIGSGLFGPRPT
jgi:PLP dependent protein